MTGNRMFSFLTRKPVNLFGGHCPYGCTYCWTHGLIKHFHMDKYLGQYCIDPKVVGLNNFKEGDIVFLNDMLDFAAAPEDMIYFMWNWIAERPKATFLTLTKNPQVYLDYYEAVPENAWLGATIESNINYPQFSSAPSQEGRLDAMTKLSQLNQASGSPNELFICIEPVMRFGTIGFMEELKMIAPHAVAVGYDNYHNGLPEPDLAETMDLIDWLETFTRVYRKTLREAVSF